MKRLHSMRTCAILILLVFPPVVSAQKMTAATTEIASGKCTRQGSVDVVAETVRMRITPSKPPIPALKYRFYFQSLEQRSGNRASHYRREFDTIKSAARELHKQYDDFDGQALEYRFNADNLERSADRVTEIFPRLLNAVTFRTCDWGLGLEVLEGKEVFEFLLPEIAPMRTATRLLSVKSRHELETGEFEQAYETIRVGYQMSRDMADGELLVLKLVGVAMAAVTHAQVENFIATPDSPNLYWALASLESPFIDMRSSVRYEAETCFRALPLLREASKPFSSKEWTRRLGDAIVDVAGLTDVAGSFANRSLSLSDQTPPWQRQVAATALIALAYPDARRQLLAAGMSETHLDSLPAGQVVVMQQARVVKFLTDEMEKICYLPSNSLAKSQVDEVSTFGNTPVGREYVPVASLLLPGMRAVRASQDRTDRKIAALRVIEAIRAHLAESNGELPESLDAITALPIPRNPVTSEPFSYHLDGDTAILELPKSDLPAVGYSIRYELKVTE